MRPEHLKSWYDFSKNDWYENWYPLDYYEGLECFLRKIEAFPWGAWIAERENVGSNGTRDDKVIGYAIGHPWGGNVPELGANQFNLPTFSSCDYFYIHDVCAAPNFKGCGVGTSLVGKLLNIAFALGYRQVKLVSVLNSHSFWKRFGFEVVQECLYGGKPSKVMIKYQK
jgi:ribosomal protein S18 acetylase RimI-like enzyme